MTIKDFVLNYNMHDSLINRIDILENGSLLEFWIDFAFWMQNGYDDSNDETGILKVTFSGVKSYIIPDNICLDEISILEMVMDNDGVKFSLVNDLTDDYLEIIVYADQVSAEAIKG